jgi:tetratricopeptide (TPR) repeat protein
MKYIVGKCPECGKTIMFGEGETSGTCFFCHKGIKAKDAFKAGILARREAAVGKAKETAGKKDLNATRDFCYKALGDDPSLWECRRIIADANLSEISLFDFRRFDAKGDFEEYVKSVAADSLLDDAEKKENISQFVADCLKALAAFSSKNEKHLAMFHEVRGEDSDYAKRLFYVLDVLKAYEAYLSDNEIGIPRPEALSIIVEACQHAANGVSVDGKKKTKAALAKDQLEAVVDTFDAYSTKLESVNPDFTAPEIDRVFEAKVQEDEYNAICPICDAKLKLNYQDAFAECPNCHQKISVKDAFSLKKFDVPIPDSERMVKYYFEGRFADAEKFCDNILSIDPSDLDAAFYKSLSTIARSTPMSPKFSDGLDVAKGFDKMAKSDKSLLSLKFQSYSVELIKNISGLMSLYLDHIKEFGTDPAEKAAASERLAMTFSLYRFAANFVTDEAMRKTPTLASTRKDILSGLELMCKQFVKDGKGDYSKLLESVLIAEKRLPKKP